MTRVLLALAALVGAALAIVWLSARDLVEPVKPEQTYTEHDGTTWKYTAPPSWLTDTIQH